MADPRRRMVVEEVTPQEEEKETLQTGPLDNLKEKVEELQEVTEDLNQDVEKAEDVQEEIAEAVEEAAKPIEHQKLHEHLEAHNVVNNPTEREEETREQEVQSDEEPEEETKIEEVDDTPEQFPPLERPKGTNPLIIIVPGIFLLGALLGGIYFYQKGINLPPSASPEPTPAEVVSPSASPSASPLATADLSKYPINVMNGSGIAGEAGKVKTILQDGGFKVSATGNASSYDFTKTVIKVKSDVPASFVSQLTSLLGKTYELDANQTLPASSSDSVQVIVGSTKAK